AQVADDSVRGPVGAPGRGGPVAVAESLQRRGERSPLLTEHLDQVLGVKVACTRGPQEQRAGQARFGRRAAIGHRPPWPGCSRCRSAARIAGAGSVPRRGRPPAFAGVDRGLLAAVRSAPVAAVDGGQALLERDAALARIDQCLREAAAGRGSLLLLEGPAGIGKTRLVVAAGRRGRELGLTTLGARGSELERDFAYGLVRQLFEAPLAAAAPPDRAELLAGAAGHAAALFGVA